MRCWLTYFCLALPWLAGTSSAGPVVHGSIFVPDHVLRVSIGQVAVGGGSEKAVLVNGTMPGPEIRLAPGARSWIRVYNDMEQDNLTMHWHGLAQNMAPFADGAPLASQWPIGPGHFFDYEIMTELDDAGTYYYHSHVLMQAASCFGALVVEDCGSAPYDYDDERLMLFSDLFKLDQHAMVENLVGPKFKFTETDGLLLNGQGVPKGSSAVQGMRGGIRGRFGGGHGSHPGFPGKPAEARTVTFPQIPASELSSHSLPVIDMDPGKTYRLRFIGGTGLSSLVAALEGHGNFTVIQVDGGEYNVPVSTERMQLGAGQRFDVLFKAKTEAELAIDGKEGLYFLQYETRGRAAQSLNYAVVRYFADTPVPLPPQKPIFEFPETMHCWLEYAFQPLYPERNHAPTAADVTRRIVIDVQQSTDRNKKMVWKYNNLQWTEQSQKTPYLVDIYTRGEAAVPNYDAALKNNGWDPDTRTFPARVGEVLEIVFYNRGSRVNCSGKAEAHPIHAHGKHVFDMGSGDGEYDAQKQDEFLKRMNYQPVRRDTTMLYSFREKVKPGKAAGWRALRIRMDSPGVWMIHCHILHHMITGMQSVWIVGNATEVQKIPPSYSEGYITPNGPAYGNATFSPTYYDYFGKRKNTCRPRPAKKKPCASSKDS